MKIDELFQGTLVRIGARVTGTRAFAYPEKFLTEIHDVEGRLGFVIDSYDSRSPSSRRCCVLGLDVGIVIISRRFLRKVEVDE